MGEAPKAIQSPGSLNRGIAPITGEASGNQAHAQKQRVEGNAAVNALDLFAQGYTQAREIHPLTRQTETFHYTVDNPFGPAETRTREVITPLDAQVAEVFGAETKRRQQAAEALGGFIYEACSVRETSGRALHPNDLLQLLMEKYAPAGHHLAGIDSGNLIAELTGRPSYPGQKVPTMDLQSIGKWQQREATSEKPLKQTVDAWISNLSLRANPDLSTGDDLSIDNIRNIWGLTMKAVYAPEDYVDVENQLMTRDLDTLFNRSLLNTEKQLGIESNGKITLSRRDRVVAYLWSLPDSQLEDLTLPNLAILGTLLIPRHSQQRNPDQPGYLPITKQQTQAHSKEMATVILGIGLESQKNGNETVVQKCQDALKGQPDLQNRLSPKALGSATS